MAASIEKSRDMQMRNCDVISLVTALDPWEPATQLTRSAPLTILPQNSASGAIIEDDTLLSLSTVSPQNGVMYANLCKYILIYANELWRHITWRLSTNQNRRYNWPVAPLLTILPQNSASGAIIEDDTLRSLTTVSPQKGVMYANLYKFMLIYGNELWRHMSRDNSRPIRTVDTIDL